MVGFFSPADRDKLSAAIDAYLARTGKKARDLAREAEVSEVAISNYRNKMRGPSPETLIRLANAMGVSPLDLMPE